MDHSIIDTKSFWSIADIKETLSPHTTIHIFAEIQYNTHAQSFVPVAEETIMADRTVYSLL